MALERGRLVLNKKGKPQIEINGKLFNPAQAELSQSIIENLKELNGAEVEFELEGGQPKRIHEVGLPFVSQQTSTSNFGHSRINNSKKQMNERTAHQSISENRSFYNPYNFIPAPPRKTDDPQLGDHKPVAQDRFHPDRITGRIRVNMETVTPLLVPDSNECREKDNGHKSFALLLDKDGKPLLPSSSIRGMLRSAYEAVTNSRFGRFPKNDHGKRLAYRMEAREGLSLIPARIEDGNVHLLPGTSRIKNDGSPDGPQYAAWLPQYTDHDKNTKRDLTYPDGSFLKHRQEVYCMVRLFQHHRWDKRKNCHVPDFKYWQVYAIAKDGSELPNINQTPAVKPLVGRSWHEPKEETLKIRGWICITNPNINRKCNERVFFWYGCKPPGPFPVNDELRRKWTELIENYQEIHKEDLKKREKQMQKYFEYLGPEPGRTAWSRHVYTEEERELQDNTLCYARLKNGTSGVDALFPVMIARDLYAVSPWDLVDPSLRPASRIEELSPADRVFGWVQGDSNNQRREPRNPTAVRGLLRIGPVRCDSASEEAIEVFASDGLPLAILAAPKPQQGRFYVAASPQGEAQKDRLSKVQAGYMPGKGLRGRKVYPHHNGLPAGHWENATEDRTQNTQSPWQEYRRPKKNGQEQCDDQNRSIRGWVKPGARFSFDIYVTNLSRVELGALLFLLKLPEEHYHRFGGGKPLGFGSVRLSVSECKLRTGELLYERYRAWSDECRCEDISEGAIAAFKEAVSHAYGRADGNGSFEEVSFIKAFLKACTGFDNSLPVHYPRVTKQPSPDGESFKWFVANEKEGARFALGDLAHDPGLPTLQDVQASAGTRQRRRN